MNIQFVSVRRTRVCMRPLLTAMQRLNRFLLTRNLGYIDVIDGRYVIVLRAETPEPWDAHDPDHVGQGGIDAGWYER